MHLIYQIQTVTPSTQTQGAVDITAIEIQRGGALPAGVEVNTGDATGELIQHITGSLASQMAVNGLILVTIEPFKMPSRFAPKPAPPAPAPAAPVSA